MDQREILLKHTLNLCNNVSVFLYMSQINFVNKQFKDSKKEWVLLVCIGASSGVGRLAFGKIGDLIPGLQKIYMQVRKCMNGFHGETAQPPRYKWQTGLGQ